VTNRPSGFEFCGTSFDTVAPFRPLCRTYRLNSVTVEAPSRHGSVLDGALIGRTLDGRYAVQSRLAQGGMATVYRAWDNRLDRLVALKVIDPELARHPEYVARFIREAKSAAKLSHPNIVAVYDQSALPGRGPGEGGAQPPLAYLAMEYVPGVTLRQLLGRRGRLTPREALEILDAMLAGLAAAHRAGIVHRDVKPENVLLNDVVLSGSHATYAAAVKVADFGLARTATGDQGTLSSSLGNGMAGGGLIGTVSYLAPELVQNGSCDVRSDVYSAGIVLFELLTGRKPFTGGTPLEIARRHVTDRVPPPSLLLPGLDPALDALVASATAREPNSRPADAAAFREQVRAVYANLPDSALNFGTPHGDATVPMPVGGGTATIPDRTRLVQQPVNPNSTQVLNRTLVGSEPAPVRIKPRTSPREGYTVQAPRRRSRKGLVVFLIILVLTAAVGIGAWVYGQVAFQNTPDLRGETQKQAQLALAADGLKYRIVSDFDNKYPNGEVAAVSPAPGTPVKQGSTITLTISKGQQAVAIPDVTGQSQGDATAALEKAGFTVSIAADPVTSSTVAKGSVASYTPGGSAARGSTVTLTISGGPLQVIVRDVHGMTVEDATAILEAQGFKVTTTRLFPLVDNVGRQSPGGGSSADYGSTITLYIFP
jgi:serine/threonine protein kinase/beta-lactam-binding protein with PASTA domain